MTQKVFASFIGLSEGSLSGIYSGRTRPTLNVVELIKEKCQINETQGVIPVKTIIEKTASIINEYFPKSVESCYLFGSYAKGYALPVSDINILLSSSLLDEEMKELERKLNEALHKNISLMSIEEAAGKVDLLKEVLKIGIRII